MERKTQETGRARFDRMLPMVEASSRGLRAHAMLYPLLAGITDTPEQIDRLGRFAVDASIRQHSDIKRLQLLLYPSGLLCGDEARVQSDYEGMVGLGKSSAGRVQGPFGTPPRAGQARRRRELHGRSS